MSTPLNSGPAFALHLNRREKKPRALARDESWSTAVERRRPVRELLTEAVSAQPPLPEAGLGRCCGPPDRTPPQRFGSHISPMTTMTTGIRSQQSDHWRGQTFGSHTPTVTTMTTSMGIIRTFPDRWCPQLWRRSSGGMQSSGARRGDLDASVNGFARCTLRQEVGGEMKTEF